MLSNMETKSIEEINMRQIQNRAKREAESCSKSPKMLMEIGHNQCVLCDLNFIGNRCFIILLFIIHLVSNCILMLLKNTNVKLFLYVFMSSVDFKFSFD